MYCKPQEYFFPLNVFYIQESDCLFRKQGSVVTEQNKLFSTVYLLPQFRGFKDKDALL